MRGMYVHCSKRLPFVDWMLSRVKPWETRGRDMLGDLVGERVAIIETGRSPVAMIRGYATITRKKTVSYDNVRARRAARILGTPYDIKPGKTKVFYRLEHVTRCKPYPLPAQHSNNGRAWTEF